MAAVHRGGWGERREKDFNVERWLASSIRGFALWFHNRKGDPYPSSSVQHQNWN